ncbi:hypothetical protein HK27_10215 [Acetobacter orientalis]|nr:hypothetical protein HK27_10215 [Acetobacter orientalis]
MQALIASSLPCQSNSAWRGTSRMAFGHSRRGAQGFANVLFDAMACRLPAFKPIMGKKRKRKNKEIKI